MHTYQPHKPSFLRTLCAGVMAFTLFGLAACGGGGDGSPPAPAPTAPTITAEPTSVAVTAPATATFSVTATGSPTPTYQWSVGGVVIAGATSATYTTPATTTDMSGASYTVTVTNAAGSVTSTPAATLTVTAAPVAGGTAIGWDGSNATGSGFNYTQGTYLIGFEFTANQAITITQLGAYDSSLGSMPGGAQTFQATPVGLYNLTTHTLLGSVTVQGSDTATKVYRYATLATPVTLNTTDSYAVVWVTGTNHYVATQFSPIILPSDVAPAINYVAFAGLGPSGLTQTTTVAEPDFFYTPGLNYDIGPNFIFQ